MGRYNIYIYHTASEGESYVDHVIQHGLESIIARCHYMIQEPSNPDAEIVQFFFNQNYLGKVMSKIINVNENTCIFRVPVTMCSRNCGICLTLVS